MPSFLFDVSEKLYFCGCILGSVVQWIVFHPDSDRDDSEDAGSIPAGKKISNKMKKRFLSRGDVRF